MSISPKNTTDNDLKLDRLIEDLVALRNDEIAAHSQRFFKTGEGEYGAGDKFLGLRVPVVREAIKPYVKKLQTDIPLDEVTPLIQHEYHEIRLAGQLLLATRFKRAKKESDRAALYQYYLSHKDYVNNWDLVDSSAHVICGGYLLDKPKDPLFDLVISNNLWHRRIAVISCFAFIKQGQFDTVLTFCEQLLSDKEDLIHKACGWMLREVGKQNHEVLITFLDQHYHKMPRTMLRYAIEKLEETLRQSYLKGTR